MAQHTSYKHYINQKWIFTLIKQCKKIAWNYRGVEKSSNYFFKINNNLELLPIEYACDYELEPSFLRQVNKVFSYKCNIHMPLTNDCNNLLVSDCGIEIHLNNREIIDIFIVA
jgi:hypothetical protein